MRGLKVCKTTQSKDEVEKKKAAINKIKNIIIDRSAKKIHTWQFKSIKLSTWMMGAEAECIYVITILDAYRSYAVFAQQNTIVQRTFCL